MNLRTYIDSGAIECCLLGLATVEEQAVLERMRLVYPELETEISVVANKLEQAAMEGGIMPPAVAWQQLSQRVKWESREDQRKYRNGHRHQASYTVINLQEPPKHRYIQVSIWWRCVVIAMGMLLMALLASNIYFYRKYHEMEERLLPAYPAAPAHAAPAHVAPATK